ncbi:MAG: ATP-binding protein [Candidatus Methanoperedens sp.]
MVEELEFKISSGLKNIIGKELITDDLIAIFELVKNSYDANAKSVKIVFQNIKEENKSKGPKILIIDDGDGMSRYDLEKKWLFVGYSEKKDFEKELDVKDFRDKIGKRKRIFAGAKGIGRFSCDRLGGILKLYTKKENEDVVHQLCMDWKKFEEDPKKEFQTIKVNYEKNNQMEIKELNIKLTKGTVLEISSLNDNWDREKLLKLKRYMQRLINPSQVGENHEFEIFLDSKEYMKEDEKHRLEGDFEVINGVVKNIVFERLGIKTTQINCKIDENGKKIYTELIDKDKSIFSLEEKNEYIALKNISIKLFFLNQEAKYTFTKIMGLQPVNYGSIFLYKNGFRIHPYGNFGDDWLGLDRRKTQGYQRFMGNRELMGRIEINGYQPDFKEVSSRDGGVIKTQSYEQLLDFFTEKVLRRLEKYVVEGLDWDPGNSVKTPEKIEEDSLALIDKIVGQVKDPEKKINFNPDLLDIFKKKQVEKIPELIKNVESLKKFVPTQKEKDYIDLQLKSFKKATKIIEDDKKETEERVEELKKDLKQTEKQILFLKSVTGEDKKELLGLQHHIGLATSTINNHLMFLKDKIEKRQSVSNEDLIKIIDKISLETQKIASISAFHTKANFNLMSEKIEKDLVSFIKQYVENVYTQYKKITSINDKLNIKVKSEDNFEFIYNFKPLEFIIILDNLINNSIKAKANNIEIIMNRLNKNGIELRIKDDGIGIPTKNINKIFDFGYTTTGGSGIGLYHVSQIVKKINGTISVNNSLEKGIEFIIKVEK